MKKKTVLAELNQLKMRYYGRNIHEVANMIATIEAACSSTNEEDVPEILKEVVEKELCRLRREVMQK